MILLTLVLGLALVISSAQAALSSQDYENSFSLSLGNQVVLDSESSLIASLRDDKLRPILLKNWQVICKQFSERKVELLAECQDQKDIDLLIEFFHDFYLVQDTVPKIIASGVALRDRFDEALRYFYLEKPDMALKIYPLAILNDYMGDEGMSLCDFFRELTMLSWNKFNDRMKGIDPEKMAQLDTITVQWTEADLKHHRFLERKMRLIHVMNRYKIPLRVIGEDPATVRVLEIENGYQIRGQEALLLTCHICRETMMTEVGIQGNPNPSIGRVCFPWILSCQVGGRRENLCVYKHYCPNCSELLLIVKDPFY